jgi:hypothetical protein
MFTSAILLAIQLLPTILQGVGVITPTLSKTITDLGAAVPGLITSLATPGATVPDETIAVLTALRTEIAALQADTKTSPAALQAAATLLEAIDDALAAYEAGERVDDPSTLQPLPVNV